MTKIISLVLALALVGVIAAAGAGTASAKGKDKQAIDIQAVIFVTAIEGFETNEKSGWSTIASESLQGFEPIFVAEGPAELDGLYLSAEQSSREKFSTPFLPLATVSEGKSKGTFYMSDISTGGTPVIGKYDLKLSSSDDCQILGEGKWKSKAKNSIIDGKGTITVCTNWIGPFDVGTFMSVVSITGSAAIAD